MALLRSLSQASLDAIIDRCDDKIIFLIHDEIWLREARRKELRSTFSAWSCCLLITECSAGVWGMWTLDITVMQALQYMAAFSVPASTAISALFAVFGAATASQKAVKMLTTPFSSEILKEIDRVQQMKLRIKVHRIHCRNVIHYRRMGYPIPDWEEIDF